MFPGAILLRTWCRSRRVFGAAWCQDVFTPWCSCACVFLSQAVAISSTVHTLRRMHLQLCGRKNQAALAQKRLGGRVAAPEVLQPRHALLSRMAALWHQQQRMRLPTP